ncbi:type VI secretion system contractile sheath small subunit [Roseovarius sp.]|uniref:type VI secretion system contractile sheath small subunit n=1 Tax=Roseovarius sp. TaxID=1486281 RepID=UPI00356351F5
MAKKTQDYSVAPKERINIVYRPATAGRKEQVELPMKLMVIGDFTQTEDVRDIEEREPVNVDDNNFDDVLASMDVSADFTVPNRTTEAETEELAVHLQFEKMSDFEPGSVIEQVPELQKMLELREALKALKGPLGNVPEMRRKIQEIIQDDKKSDKLMKELGL